MSQYIDNEMSRKRIRSAYDYLKENLPFFPKTAVTLGSGLGRLGDELDDAVVFDYKDIPGFPVSTAIGHKGRLVCGKCEGTPCLVMQGRFHCYEGYDVREAVIPIRVFKLLGVENIILTNAAGGIHQDFTQGALMLIRDHIGFVAPPVLWGPNMDEFGVRFPDMTNAYNKDLQALARTCAKTANVHMHEGVYAYTPGPQFETPAEIRALKILGADAVGMSTVPEVIAARHCSMRILALSCITNMAAGLSDGELSHEEVLRNSDMISEDFIRLLREILKAIREVPACQ